MICVNQCGDDGHRVGAFPGEFCAFCVPKIPHSTNNVFCAISSVRVCPVSPLQHIVGGQSSNQSAKGEYKFYGL